MGQADDVLDVVAQQKLGDGEDHHDDNTTTNVLPDPNPITSEPWFLAYWRPAAAWTYLAIVVFDFVLAPIFVGWFSLVTKTTLVMWSPLTLQGGGLFHVAFGAILGIYTYGRTQEKLQINKENGRG